MLNRRRIERAANEKVDLLFYKVIEKKGKKMMKPLPLQTQIPSAMVRAVLDDTITPKFYDQLAEDLKSRGITTGTCIQLRVRFNKSHADIHPTYKGTRILCEVNI